MADTGFIFPGTAVGDRTIAGSDVDWSTPSNITADDGSNATAGLAFLAQDSSGLAASNFDFSGIPVGATIDGIEARVGDYIVTNGGSIGWQVGKLILADNSDGSITKASELFPPESFPQTDEMGGAADLWSETIGQPNVTDVDWGFFVGASYLSGVAPQIEVDFMQMKVYYTEANSTGWKFPGTAVGNRVISGSDADWTNENDIKADDTNTADLSLAGNEEGSGLAASNFDFSEIADIDNIDGIEIRVEGYVVNAAASILWKQPELILADGSDGGVTKNLTIWNTFPQTDEVGDALDKWLERIDPADVKDVDWGFFVSAITTTSSARVFQIDSMQMKVYYTALPQNTGWKYPGTMVGNRTIFGSDENWSAVDNAKADDGLDATVFLPDNLDTSSGLAASNFDFSGIPAGSTIDGIEIQVGKYRASSTASLPAFQVCRLILADNSDGAISKQNDLNGFLTTDQMGEAGGATDKWSETIGLSDVQDVDWGFFLGVGINGVTGTTLRVDFMRMRVFYTEPDIGILSRGTFRGVYQGVARGI